MASRGDLKYRFRRCTCCSENRYMGLLIRSKISICEYCDFVVNVTGRVIAGPPIDWTEQA